MKKIKCLLYIIVLFFFPNIVKASEVYSLGDFVFFDPISSMACSDKDYWTPYNQDTTCYRFIVLENNDTSLNSKLKVMLDHDIGNSIYDNYKAVLDSETSSWYGHEGDIDIIDENTIYELMKLTQKPTLDNISVNGGVALGFFATNTMYIINKETHSNYGYWSKTLYEDDLNYVYTVTEYANNRLVDRYKSRGIRPVIVIDKTFLRKSSDVINIDSLIKNGIEYKYKQTELTDSNYKHLQGFTLAKDKLIFHSMNINDSELGLLFTYSGENFQTLYKYDYGNTAHGNDMTYNSRTNKVLLLVKGNIFEYDADTLIFEREYNVDDKGDLSYGAIGYDSVNDHYYVYNNQKIYVLNNNFEKLYSFDHTTLSVRQGMEYHNGYIYASTSESKCPNMYQIYCFEEEWSGITYVYNAKLKADGTPTKDFGKLVDKLYISPGIGELESVSFNNNRMYFGYATRKNDSTYLYKFYSIPYDEIAYKPNVYVNYIEDGGAITVNISSNEELKKIDGWTIDNNLLTLSKTFIEDTPSSEVEVCDLYNNCDLIELKEMTFEKGNDESLDKDEENILKNPATGEKVWLIIFIGLFSLVIMYKYIKKCNI